MGLLDWLSGDVLGGIGGGMNPMGDQTGMSMAIAPPAPPPLAVNRTPFNERFAGGGDPMTAGGAMTPPPIPLPQPRPAAADAGGDVAIPPAASLTSGAGMPSGAPILAPPPPLPPSEVQSNAGLPDVSRSPNGPRTFIGRALGLDGDTETSLRGGLAAGFKAAGNSAGKSPMQAFASGAGEGLEGSQQAENKDYDRRLKALQLDVTAQARGADADYKSKYLGYLNNSLKSSERRAAAREAGGSRAWNKPDSQRFLDAQNAISKDPDIRASQKVLEAALKGGDPKEVAAAQQSHGTLVEKKNGQYLAAVGLDPKKLGDLQKNPPGTAGNPHTITSREDFDIYVKPGESFVNPKDGKVYIRKGAQNPTGAAPAAPPSGVPTMPTMPATPDDDDD